MTRELEEKLVKKYPKIFEGYHGDPTKTGLAWGISCHDGWYWIIDHLCSSLQWMTDNPPWNKDGRMVVPQVVATQVKEKFGALRFYVQSASSEQYAKIHFAESLSYHICEICGSTKNVGHTQGWITTICEDCKNSNDHYKDSVWKRDDE